MALQLAAIATQFPTAGVGKPWLSLKEAAEYSGLPLRYLRDRAKAGEVHAINVGIRKERWMFNREGLAKIP